MEHGALEKADKYDKIEEWLKKEIKYTRKNMPFLYKNDWLYAGDKNKVKLFESYIRFYEHILKQME